MIDLTKTPVNLADKTPRILKVDGTQVPFPPKNGHDFHFREICEALKMPGNDDPLFTIAGKMEGMMMLAEDNGQAYGLPDNETATWFYYEAARRLGHNIAKGDMTPIVGNCLLIPEEMME